MALNATKRKALTAVLQASSRKKITDVQLEQIANDLIEEKTTLDEAAEFFQVSKQNLKKRLTALVEPPQQAATA